MDRFDFRPKCWVFQRVFYVVLTLGSSVDCSNVFSTFPNRLFSYRHKQSLRCKLLRPPKSWAHKTETNSTENLRANVTFEPTLFGWRLGTVRERFSLSNRSQRIKTLTSAWENIESWLQRNVKENRKGKKPKLTQKDTNMHTYV
ncbi:hypothetical protein ElyMa_006340700 [Elysia marginata]|uniref:Secreted protein n=1 Tax=Elysia marginata TaxID=1093978 RepID=A0AAV4HJK9_9GAST|nr:hypothetical protein ElyMa_006340700 [Elysia marginata]